MRVQEVFLMLLPLINGNTASNYTKPFSSKRIFNAIAKQTASSTIGKLPIVHWHETSARDSMMPSGWENITFLRSVS